MPAMLRGSASREATGLIFPPPYHLWILDTKGCAFKSLVFLSQHDLVESIQRYQAAPDCVNIEVYARSHRGRGGQIERIMIWYRGGGATVDHAQREA